MGIDAAVYWPEDMEFEVGLRMFYRLLERPSQYKDWYDEFGPRDIFGGFVNPSSIQFLFDVVYSPLPSPITVPYGYIFPGDEYFDILDLHQLPYRLFGSPPEDPFNEARIISVALVLSQCRSLQMAQQVNKLTEFGRRGPQ